METKTEFKTIDFLTCRGILNNLGISDLEIEKALFELNFDKNSLCDIQHYKNTPIHIKVKEFIRNGRFTFKNYKGEYVEEYTDLGEEWLIPSQYQGLKHGEIMFKILSNRFTWFATFLKDKSYKESETGEYFDTIGRLDVNKLPEKYRNMTVNELLKLSENKTLIKKESAWDLYEVCSEDYEIYLHTEFGSLHVPLKAILNSDYKQIKKIMESYALSYYKTKNEKYFNMIKPLESKEAKELKSFLNNN